MSAPTAASISPASGGGPAEAAPTRHLPRRVDRGTVRYDEVRVPGWSVNGLAKVLRSVDAGQVETTGTLVVGGLLSAGQLTVHGTLEARGAVTVTGRLFARGPVDAGASVHAHEATVRGALRAAGEVTVDGELRVVGSVRAPSLRAGRLSIQGSATVPGTIAADSVKLQLNVDSAIGRIQGSEVRLRGPAANLVRRVLGKDAVVTVGVVEGAAVVLEGCRVASVRAPSIVLGPDAHVVAVEGRVVRAHRTSRVGPESWSRPPAGLSR